MYSEIYPILDNVSSSSIVNVLPNKDNKHITNNTHPNISENIFLKSIKYYI